MKLTKEEQAILSGSEGQTKAKIMQTLVEFGELFGATEFVPVSTSGHLVTSFGIGLLKPVYRIMDEIIEAGLKTPYPFTVDPRPIDYKNVKCNILDKLIFSKIMYSKQKHYEEQLSKIGLKNKNAFTCTCYLEEVGNTPKYGDILSWAESSAVVFANSVLGARCNRNSGMLDIFGAILGKVPKFGLLTDDGRKADYIVEIKTSHLPEAQILGSAIGMKVMEKVPYVVGLDKFLGTELNDDTISYLKDFGAASASNGAVGLFHIDGLTPEAKEFKDKLIKEGAKTYVIDDEELERVYRSYPIMWKDKKATPKMCFIGCPHLNYYQLNKWYEDIKEALKNNNKEKVVCNCVLNTPPKVLNRFIKEEPQKYQELYKMGVTISSICPLMYTNNPLTHSKPIMTNSNKLRTYSMARYFKDEEILAILAGKKVY